MDKKLNAHMVLEEIGFMLLSEGKTLKVRAEGVSMYPLIKPGSTIFIEPFEVDSPPVPGEIVAWKREKTFVVHRLVRIVMKDNNTQFITRGDSHGYEDVPVTPGQLAGRVIRIETPRGKVIGIDHLSGKPAYLFNRLMAWLYLKAILVKRLLIFRNERKNTSVQ